MSQNKPREDFDNFLNKGNAIRLLYPSLNRVYKGKKDGDDYYFKPLSDGYIADYCILNGLNAAMPNGFLLGEYRIKFHQTEKKGVVEKNFFSPDEELDVVVSKDLGNVAGNDSFLNRELRVIKAREGGGVPVINNPFFKYGFLPISHFTGLRDIKGDNLAYGKNDKEIIVFDPMFIGNDQEANYYYYNTIKRSSPDEFFIGGMNFLMELNKGKDRLVISIGSQNIEDPKTISRINAWLKYEQSVLLEHKIIKSHNEFPATFQKCKEMCTGFTEDEERFSAMSGKYEEEYVINGKFIKSKDQITESKKRKPVIFEDEYWEDRGSQNPENPSQQNLSNKQINKEAERPETRRVKTQPSQESSANKANFRIKRRLKTEVEKEEVLKKDSLPKKKELNLEVSDIYLPFDGTFSKKEKPKKKEDIYKAIRQTAIGLEPVQTKKMFVHRPNRKLFAVKDSGKVMGK